MKVKNIWICLALSACLFSCSSDDSGSNTFSPPAFLFGTWQNPGVENPIYTFSSNNIIENECCRGPSPQTSYVLDYRMDFDESDFIITERIEENYYEIRITSRTNEVFEREGGQTVFFRAFRRAIVQGEEAIILEYAGYSGFFMYKIR